MTKHLISPLAPCPYKAIKPKGGAHAPNALTVIRINGKLAAHAAAQVWLASVDVGDDHVSLRFPMAMVDFTTAERQAAEAAAEAQRLEAQPRIALELTGLKLPLTLPAESHMRQINAELVNELAADLAAQIPALLAAALGVGNEPPPAA